MKSSLLFYYFYIQSKIVYEMGNIYDISILFIFRLVKQYLRTL